MIRKLVRDESGMTMGLVVIMIVLIGVMGAGLLTFARRDLDAVVEVNRGQQAFEAADAGIEAARRELLSDAQAESYDGTGSESDWSYADPDAAGRDLTFDGRDVNVRVRYLPPVREPRTPNQDQAPEVIPASAPADQTEAPSGCRFFKATSESESGGARRRIEAIFCARQLSVPTAYYTPNNISFSGDVSIGGVSFFAGGNIAGIEEDSVDIDRTTPALYGDWDSTKFTPPSNHNTTARRVDAAGFGAEGLVCGGARCNGDGDSAADGVNDFDRTTGTKGDRRRFIGKSAPEGPQTSREITYPFDVDTSLLIRFLEEEAKRQSNYYGAPQNIGSTTAGGKAKYPEDSTDRTVFFMDAQGRTVDIDYAVNYSDVARGTLVIRDGNLKIDDSSNGFDGVIIVTGNGSTTGNYQSSDTVTGFVIADGDMVIRGTVAPPGVTEDFGDRPGFYDVNVWSWRELYQ